MKHKWVLIGVIVLVVLILPYRLASTAKGLSGILDSVGKLVNEIWLTFIEFGKLIIAVQQWFMR